jgi:RNA polymerase sigma-70 factor (ECF subfamily)
MQTTLLELFLSERRRLVRAIGKIVRNHAAAEDLAQDAFLRLWGRTGIINARGLLFQTAHNLAIDHVRAQRVRAHYLDGIAVEQVRGQVPSPEVATESRRELDAFVGALRRLPERAQRAFLLNRLDGLSYNAIAKQLGVSVSTVEKDIARGLDLCRQWAMNRTD